MLPNQQPAVPMPADDATMHVLLATREEDGTTYGIAIQMVAPRLHVQSVVYELMAEHYSVTLGTTADYDSIGVPETVWGHSTGDVLANYKGWERPSHDLRAN